MCQSFFSKVELARDETLFLKQISDGNFYEKFRDEIHEMTGEWNERDKIKEMIFFIFYGKNGQTNKFIELFRWHYPNVWRKFKIIKRGNYRRLSYLLQRIESYLFIETISKRISKEKPNIPIFTIHDSVSTTQGNEDYVASVMEDELERFVGIKPNLKVEKWRQNSTSQLVEMFMNPKNEC